MKRFPVVITAVLSIVITFSVFSVIRRADANDAGPSSDTPVYFAGTYSDGGGNSFSDYWVPTSDHPSGWTYIDFSKDSTFLNVKVEVTGDNTDDVEDWSSLTIGGQEFRIDDGDTTYGTCPFGSTDHVGYAHATCEFRIPLAQLPDGDFPFVLRYYGTFSGPNVPNLQTADDTGIYNDDNYTSETDLTFDENCQSFAWAYLYRDDTTAGNYIDSAACSLGSAVLEDLDVSEGAYSYHVRYGDDGTGADTVAGDGLSVHVDTTAPTVESGTIITANEAQIQFDEGVYGFMCDYGGVCGFSSSVLTLNGDDVRNITASSGNGTELITLTFDGPPVTAGATGTITLNEQPLSIKDQAGNELAEDTGVPLNGSNEVWVDDDFTDDSTDGGHDWEFDAFDTIQAGVDAVGENGIVHVAASDGYDEQVNIATEGITIIGDPGDEGRGPAEDAPVLDYCDDGPAMNINASDVTVEGLVFVRECSEADLYVSDVSGTQLLDNAFVASEFGIQLGEESHDVTISRNVIVYHGVGIFIQWSWDNEISDNEIAGAEGYGIWFDCGDECDVSGTVVENNYIHSNGYGIYWNVGDQESPVTIGPGNEITDNCEGVYIDSNTTNLVITGNSIHDNIGCLSGLHVDSGMDTNTVHAERNWWGSKKGPTIASNPQGDGDEISNASEDTVEILYKPFCLDEDCGRLSSEHRSSGGVMAGSQLAKLLGLPSPTSTPTPTPSPEIGAPMPPPFLFTLFLSRGMSGPDVKALQEKLKALGFFPADIPATGYFGPITEAAVKAFQKAHGIDPVGFVGPRTRAALNQ